MRLQRVETVRLAAARSLAVIRCHRFVRAAHGRALSHEQAIRWIMCAGRESRSFPDILTGMIERTQDAAIIQILQENLADEYGNGNPEQAHFKHYIHLLRKIGITEQQFAGYSERAGIKLALALAYSMACEDNSAIALGYMLVNEGMTPITYGAADVALHQYHPDLETSFFRLHVEVDEHHVAELYRAVAQLPNSAVDDIVFGIQLGERGMAVLLDEALGVFDVKHPFASAADQVSDGEPQLSTQETSDKKARDAVLKKRWPELWAAIQDQRSRAEG